MSPAARNGLTPFRTTLLVTDDLSQIGAACGRNLGDVVILNSDWQADHGVDNRWHSHSWLCKVKNQEYRQECLGHFQFQHQVARYAETIASSSYAAILAALLYLAPGTLALSQTSSVDVSHGSERRSPAWVRSAVIYEINPRTFSEAGNFNGITARLDDLKNLGVTVLWLMPIHPVGQLMKKGTIGSPYAVRDYYAINRDYGKKDDLCRLVTEAHKRGLKVIIDIVANHTAWDSVMMKTPGFYRRDASGHIVSPHDWTDVAALNYANPQLRTYMMDMLKYWLREFDLDGFRCDVAGEVPTDFWEEARAELDKLKPDLMMLAEADKRELLVNAFDVDYAWAFYHSMVQTLAEGAPSSVLRATWDEERAKYPRGALHMRFVDNHDEDRSVVRFGLRGSMAAATLVFTVGGVPLLYNGVEVGDTTESGAPALFEKLRVFWLVAERRPQFPRFYEYIIALRRAHPALREGETEWVHNSDEARVVTYLRKAASEELLVAINLTNRPFTGSVDVGNGAQFHEVTPDLGKADYPSISKDTQAFRALSLDSWGFRIFQRESK